MLIINKKFDIKYLLTAGMQQNQQKSSQLRLLFKYNQVKSSSRPVFQVIDLKLFLIVHRLVLFRAIRDDLP
jgi:hypothetical protein